MSCSSSSKSSSSSCGCSSSSTLIGISCDSCSSPKCSSVSCCEESCCSTISACTSSTQQVEVKKVCPVVCDYDSGVVIATSTPIGNESPKTQTLNSRIISYSRPDITGFNTVVTPVKSLTPQYSPSNSAAIQLRMRRKNKTVTLQWEPFTGATSQAGRSWIDVEQQVANLPPYSIRFPIQITYKGINRMTVLSIDPFDTISQIKFYLATNGEEINTDENFSVYGGAVTWIVD